VTLLMMALNHFENSIYSYMVMSQANINGVFK
jgi:hypothetical protein